MDGNEKGGKGRVRAPVTRRHRIADRGASEHEHQWVGEELRKAHRALRIFSMCNRALVRATDETGLLQEICRVIVGSGGYRLAWVGLAEQGKKKTVRPVAQAGYEAGYLDTVNITWADTERGRNPTGTAIRTGRPVIARNLMTDPSYALRRAEARKRGYASCIALPLLAEGQAIGALNIYAAEPDAFDEKEVRLLGQLADDLAFGVMTLRIRAEHGRAEEALRESQERYRDLYQEAPHGYFSVDADGRIVMCNRSAVELLGYPLDELVGRQVFDLYADTPDGKEKAHELFRRSQADGEIAGEELEMRRADGGSVWVSLTVGAIRDEKGRVVRSRSMVVDITDRKRAEAEATWRTQRLEALQQVSQAVSGSLDLETVAALALEAAIQVLDMDAGFIRYLDETTQELVLLTHLGLPPELAQEADAHPRLKLGQGLGGIAAQSGEPLIVEDVPREVRLLFPSMRQSGFQVYAAVPLKVQERVVGVMSGFSRRRRTFTPADMEMMASIGNMVGMAIANARLLQEVSGREEVFRSLADSSPVGIYIVQDRKFQFVNPQFQQDTGYSEDELVGTSSLRLVFPEDEDMVRANAVKMLKGELSFPYEYRTVNKGGEIRWILETVSSVQYRGRRATLGNFMDITERKQQEAEVRQRARQMEALQQVSQAVSGSLALEAVASLALESALHALDLDAGTVVIRDETTQELVALSDHGLPSKVAREIRAHPRRKVGQGLAGIVAQSGEPMTLDDFTNDPRLFNHAWKQSGFLSFAGIPLKVQDRVVGTMSGFSRRQRSFTPADMEMMASLGNMVGMAIANARLFEESQQRTRRMEALQRVSQAVSGSLDLKSVAVLALEAVIKVLDLDACAIRYLDETTQELVWLSQRGLPPEMAKELYKTAFRLKVDRSLAGVVAQSGEPLMADDFTHDPRLSNPVWRRSDFQCYVGLPLKVQDGVVGVMSCFSRCRRTFTPADMEMMASLGNMVGMAIANARLYEDRRQRTEELEKTLQQLQTTQEQLIQSDRLAAIGQLVSGVAHEVNNPLTAVLGYAQLLLGKDQDEAVKSDLEVICREAQRAATITRNLLSFARQHKPEKSYISINEAVESTVALRAYEMKVNNIEVVTELQPDLPRTVADLHQLQQVFLNMVINAEQAITVARGRGKLAVKTQEVDHSIQIVFADDGPGIPREYLSRVFDPFFTTKEPGKGTGLGLSICYGIVQEHGGNIRVESKRRKGATFTVEIPVVGEEAVASVEG